MKCVWSCLCLLSLFVGVFGTGEVVFLHAPKSILFKGHEVIDQSLLKHVLASGFGFTISKGSDWNGLVLKDPFHLSEAAVVVVVDGVKSLGSIKGHSFPVISDEDESVGWQKLKEKIEMRFPGFNNTLQRIDLAEGSSASVDEETDQFNPNGFSITYLDDSNTEDVEFLRQLHLLSSLGDKEYKANEDLRDGLPDLFWIVFSALHPVIDLHGDDSPAADEAKQLLRDALVHLKKGFINSYDGQVIVAALTSDVSHTRRAREATENEQPSNTTKPKNLSKDYSENYPVIFNIILWLMVAFVFSLIAISTAISTMDPGRDSIIYRMTSNRMKKDN